MKKKFHSWFIIPKYEKRIKKLIIENAELEKNIDYLIADRNKYKRRFRELNKLLKSGDINE